jgi:hypothetical protein
VLIGRLSVALEAQEFFMSNFNQPVSSFQESNTVSDAGVRVGPAFFAVRLCATSATLEIELPYLGQCIFYPQQELFYSKKHQTHVLPIIKNVPLGHLKIALLAYCQHYENTQQAA